MRVLMMQDWNRVHGGAEAHATLLRDGLLAAGDDVRLVTGSQGTAGDTTADYVALSPSTNTPKAFFQIINPFAVAAVHRVMREFRPDVAWVNMFALQLSPAALLSLGRLPLVLFVSDYKLTCPIGSKLLPNGSLCNFPAGLICRHQGCVTTLHWLRDQPRYALIRLAIRRANRVLACSAWIRDSLEQAGIQSTVTPLPSPTPGQHYKRACAAQPTFLFCGRLEREKGVDHLLRAFSYLHAELPEARLRIAGRGSQMEQLIHLAGALGIKHRVSFLGWLSPTQIEKQLAEAWASVVPSLWAEPLGLVAVEAILRSVPVIASAAGGLAEIVEHGRGGLLYPIGNDNALLDCFRAIANRSVFLDHCLSSEIVTAAAEQFSVDRHISLIRSVFEEIAGRGTSDAIAG
jgi:glycosyltransferase involved in cell wall biosynthesis